MYAQIVEDDLKLIVAAGTSLGLITTGTRKKHPCFGDLKEIIKRNRKEGDTDDVYDLFDQANQARRLLAHRFFIEHAVDLMTEAGHEAINQHLSKLFLTICQARCNSTALRNAIFLRMGLSENEARDKLEEIKRTILDDDENT